MKNHTFTKSVVILTAIIMLTSNVARTATIRVPQDQPTIQDGINAASNGDMVLVADDTYYENISFMGKAITVASHFVVDGDTSHINNTIIDGSKPTNPDSGSTVYFVSGENTSSVLTGFTISGGTGTPVNQDVIGGGLLIRNAGAKIVKNKIINNHITAPADISAGGAAINAYETGDVVIRDNKISNNSATTLGSGFAYGTAIINTNATCIVENNHISDNVLNSPSAGAMAAGLMADGWDGQEGAYIFRNNIIRNNTLNTDNSGGGGVVIQNCSAQFYNNIVSGNTAGSWGAGGLWISHWKFADNVLAPKPSIINNTIINNETTGSGGGIRIDGESNAYLMNNIVWDNSASTMPQIGKSSSAGIKVQYSIVQGGYSGEGNKKVDPMLIADSLANESPAIGAGAVACDFGAGVVMQCPTYGINGTERPSPNGSMPDIGAWESPLKFPVGFHSGTIVEIPEDITLHQNYPNPFNPTTQIAYDLPRPGNVKLIVYNALGKEVAELVNDYQVEGSHSVRFDAQELPTGIYFYQLQMEGRFSEKKKMMVLK